MGKAMESNPINHHVLFPEKIIAEETSKGIVQAKPMKARPPKVTMEIPDQHTTSIMILRSMKLPGSLWNFNNRETIRRMDSPKAVQTAR